MGRRPLAAKQPAESDSEDAETLVEPRPFALAESGRVEAFSDGVLAIVITLLVLDLQAPVHRGQFLHELVVQWPGYVAYLASFGFAGVVWINHHQLFSRVARVDVGLLWRNLALLLTTSILPFPASVLAASFQHGTTSDQTYAVILYCALAALMASTWLVIFRHLDGHRHLLERTSPSGFFNDEQARSIVGIGLYVVAAALSIWQPLAGLILAAVLPVFYGVTSDGWSKFRGHPRRGEKG
jgi:uncharacterized membrane protein